MKHFGKHGVFCATHYRPLRARQNVICPRDQHILSSSKHIKKSFFRFSFLFGFQCAFENMHGWSRQQVLDNRAKLSLKARFQANERRLLRGDSPNRWVRCVAQRTLGVLSPHRSIYAVSCKRGAFFVSVYTIDLDLSQIQTWIFVT